VDWKIIRRLQKGEAEGRETGTLLLPHSSEGGCMFGTKTKRMEEMGGINRPKRSGTAMEGAVNESFIEMLALKGSNWGRRKLIKKKTRSIITRS